MKKKKKGEFGPVVLLKFLLPSFTSIWYYADKTAGGAHQADYEAQCKSVWLARVVSPWFFSLLCICFFVITLAPTLRCILQV